MDIEQMKADRETGTPGPWVATATPDLSLFVCIDNDTHDVVASIGTVSSVDARRIARVPDLEAAVIAQNALIKELVKALERIAHASEVYGVEEHAEDQGAYTLAYAHKSTCNLARETLAKAKAAQ